ncbi:phosphoribosylformylglycinamidine synthase subunit PurQ [Hankyongella ginsenosidimutans]|uniref:Phosphoribosylformylglycinamidine synthase subunit PurQ n=1 Tax=Hankyongella ginsenosidimutans TaxID=1763828 RepID=A0A4D7BU08_9SPHN|nr:phosphoribosylformylglycinamidine synthase subunit PurQ [Hankyongella ginsenosidimutans]QCI79059.1 phosphoribosylformylglycinamidine synthase subunit PurQ [Hankyongella ginsenosidimutans]
MKAAVIVFPGSNCDRDLAVALERITGSAPRMVWHGDAALPDGLDLIAVPGGFSYGDYLRSGHGGAVADHARRARRSRTRRRGAGVCNGFQVLTEAGLLPGALMRNAGLKFVCRDVHLTVENADTAFTSAYVRGQAIRIPVAHHDGNYFADEATLNRLEGDGRVVFRYRDNPNGSQRDIAGIINETGNVLGLMPHPERLCEPAQGGSDGRGLFESLLKSLH